MWARIRSGAVFVGKLLRVSAREYGLARASRMAAAISYRTIFALAPLFLIALAVFGAVLGNSASAQNEVLGLIRRVAGPDVAEAVATLVGSAIEGGEVAAVVGFVLFLWTSSSLFFEVQNDLNDIFWVPYQRTAGLLGFLKKRGIGFLWALGLGVVLIAVSLLNVGFSWLQGLFPPDELGLHRLLSVLTPIASLLLLPVVFALTLQTMTDVTVRWRSVWIGGVFTSIVFVGAGVVTGLYFSWSPDTSASQIAGAAFVILLLAFVLSSVFLFGAVVTKVYDDYVETGVLITPTDRESGRDEQMVVSQPKEPLAITALATFLIGLVLGSRRRRE
jgi:membrane protein